MRNFHKGAIVGWSGSIASIPPDFVLCDGNNNTPDLRDKFIIGSSPAYPIGDEGGNAQHLHTFTGDGHSHAIATFPPAVQDGTGRHNISTTVFATGASDLGNSLPPYYALCFIMEL